MGLFSEELGVGIEEEESLGFYAPTISIFHEADSRKTDKSPLEIRN